MVGAPASSRGGASYFGGTTIIREIVQVGLTDMLYLGNVIGQDGVQVHEENINRVIWDWLVPGNVTTLRGV